MLRDTTIARCSVTPFKQLDMVSFKASLTEFVDTIASLKHISENLSDVDALAIMAADGPRKVLQMLHAHSNAVKRYLEILLKLRHPGMRERHWVQFFALFEVRVDSRTLLRVLTSSLNPNPNPTPFLSLLLLLVVLIHTRALRVHDERVPTHPLP